MRQRTTSSAAAAWKCRERAVAISVDRGPPRPSPTSASEAKRQTDQEQIQMIATAIGIPKPSAPKIARTNSESRLTRCRTPDDVMTLLLGAPRATARPQDELSIAPLDRGPRRLSVIKQCWAVMVNKRLTRGRSYWRNEFDRVVWRREKGKRCEDRKLAQPKTKRPVARPGFSFQFLELGSFQAASSATASPLPPTASG